MKRFILSALFFVTLLSIWHLLVLAKIWSPVLLPDPISVWEYLKGADCPKESDPFSHEAN